MNKFTLARSARSVDEITGSRRLRRMRKADWSRRLVRETHLTVNDLIWPIFLIEGENRTEDIAAMPGVHRLTIDRAVHEAERWAPFSGKPVELWSKLAGCQADTPWQYWGRVARRE